MGSRHRFSAFVREKKKQQTKQNKMRSIIGGLKCLPGAPIGSHAEPLITNQGPNRLNVTTRVKGSMKGNDRLQEGLEGVPEEEPIKSVSFFVGTIQTTTEKAKRSAFLRNDIRPYKKGRIWCWIKSNQIIINQSCGCGADASVCVGWLADLWPLPPLVFLLFSFLF